MKGLKLGEIICRVERVLVKIVTYLKRTDSFMFEFDLLKAKCFSLFWSAFVLKH